MSLGGTENNLDRLEWETMFSQKKARNISFVASAGDTGAEVSYPASSKYVTSVGGTKLYLDELGNRIPGVPTDFDPVTGQPIEFQDIDCEDIQGPTGIDEETIPGIGEGAWWEGGGGVSSVFAAPRYQENRLGNAARFAVDLAYNADPRTGVAVYNSAGAGGESGWAITGGTSAGAPQIAAMVALANQMRAQAGRGKIGNTLNNRLYQLGGRGPDAYFNDIELHGTGPIIPDEEQCPDEKDGFINPALIGFDLASGWGSPNARSIIPALADVKPATIVNRAITYNARLLRPIQQTTGALVATYRGGGSIAGRSTITLNLNPGANRFNPLETILFTSSDDITPTASPQPILLDRNGNTFSGDAFVTVFVNGVIEHTGNIKIVGRITKNGGVSGEFYSTDANGNRLTQNGLVPVISGTFK
jgi:subtilase family serine protease